MEDEIETELKESEVNYDVEDTEELCPDCHEPLSECVCEKNNE